VSASSSCTVPPQLDQIQAVCGERSTETNPPSFCWGDKHVTLLCSGVEKATDGKRPLIDCGFAAHPSSLAVPADIDPVTLPLSYANGSLDIQLTEPKMEIVKPIFERKTKEGVECELVVYDGAKHGFAVRGNEKDERQMRQLREARDQAVRWFGKHLPAKK